MTAIVSAYTPQGFVIAADGLRRGSAGCVISNTARKIFQVERGQLSLAFAWTGATSLYASNGEVIFDFIEQSKSAIDALMNVQMDEVCGPFRYVSAFLNTMYESFERCNGGSTLSGETDGLPREEIARAVFVGYSYGVPYRAKVSFPRQGCAVLKPCLMELIQSPYDFDTFSGSIATNALFAPRLKYAPASIETAAALVRDYVQLCIDNPTHDEECEKIGGHIHIAAVTPEGFQWLIPPEPDTPRESCI